MFRRFLRHKVNRDKGLLLIFPKHPLFPRLLRGTFVGNVNLVVRRIPDDTPETLFHALTRCQRWHRLAAFTFMAATQVHLAQGDHHMALATCHPPYPTPSSATRNWVRFACMICYEMLRFPGVSRNSGEPSFCKDSPNPFVQSPLST